MSGMKSRNRPIILDSQIDIPAFRVRQADDGSDQIAVAQPAAIALEFDRQTLALGDVAGHWISPFSRSCPLIGARRRSHVQAKKLPRPMRLLCSFLRYT